MIIWVMDCAVYFEEKKNIDYCALYMVKNDNKLNHCAIFLV